MDTAALSALLQELFPVEIGYRGLFFTGEGGVEERPTGDLCATFQLVVFEPSESGAPGGRSIRDVKEQQLFLVPAPVRDDPARVSAYLRGWAAALREVLDGAQVFELLMPSDLLQVDVLRLQRARTEEDFCRALLQRSRLGGLVPGLAPRPGPGQRPAAPVLAQGPASAAWVQRVLADLLPLREGRWRLEPAPGRDPWSAQTPRGVEVALQLAGTGAPAQAEEVVLIRGPVEQVEARRVRAYLCGWASALRALFAERRWHCRGGTWAEERWDLGRAAPRELVAPEVLRDKALCYPEEFCQALLAPEALGRHITRAEAEAQGPSGT
jgi:hypothetical protein